MSDRAGTDPGTILYRIDKLERRCDELHDKLGHVINVQIATVGKDGTNGRLGRLKDDVDGLGAKVRGMAKDFSERLRKLELGHYRVLAIAFAGSVIGSFLAKYVLGGGL